MVCVGVGVSVRACSSILCIAQSQHISASPNAIPDSQLSWPQVMRAKSAFLNALRLGTWPDDFIAMFAGFYGNMDMHRELQEQDGDRVMAHYHAEMRLAWYDAMERKEPFDLSIISDRVLGESRQQIVKQKQEKSLKAKHAKLPIHPPPLAKLADKRTAVSLTLPTFSAPLGKPINLSSHAATDVSDMTNTTFGTVHEPPYGTGSAESPATGTNKAISKLPKKRVQDSSSELTGRGQMDAQVMPIPRNTAAQVAQTAVMELAAVLTESSCLVRTPLQAQAWELAIMQLNLTCKYPTIAESI
ncbi:MAG: hypothetical protein NXY57DRAFT_1074421 [Lentinula lateritia]|nr:MAG: hypothetical protein NXY57DRAFT_1074421 [Lentinula lateritia]